MEQMTQEERVRRYAEFRGLRLDLAEERLVYLEDRLSPGKELKIARDDFKYHWRFGAWSSTQCGADYLGGSYRSPRTDFSSTIAEKAMEGYESIATRFKLDFPLRLQFVFHYCLVASI